MKIERIHDKDLPEGKAILAVYMLFAMNPNNTFTVNNVISSLNFKDSKEFLSKVVIIDAIQLLLERGSIDFLSSSRSDRCYYLKERKQGKKITLNFKTNATNNI